MSGFCTSASTIAKRLRQPPESVAASASRSVKPARPKISAMRVSRSLSETFAWSSALSITERIVSPGANSDICNTQLTRVPLRIATSPLSGFTPFSIARSVDLPEPFGPMMPMRSPSDIVKEISRKSGATPYRLDSPCALMIGGKFLSVLLEVQRFKNTVAVLASEAGEHALGPSKPYAVLNLSCMHPAIPRLLELQTVDLHIAALRAELESFPKRIQEADLKLTGARNAVAAAREAHTHSLTERKKFELDVQQWKDRAKNTEAALKIAEQSIAAERKEIHALYVEKKKELDAALVERERAVEPVPEDLRVLYERIAKRHHGVALAEA